MPKWRKFGHLTYDEVAAILRAEDAEQAEEKAAFNALTTEQKLAWLFDRLTRHLRGVE